MLDPYILCVREVESMCHKSEGTDEYTVFNDHPCHPSCPASIHGAGFLRVGGQAEQTTDQHTLNSTT